jgi:hypothetical protein
VWDGVWGGVWGGGFPAADKLMTKTVYGGWKAAAP